MKNIPVFTTDYGVASLVLKEIPYRGEAYFYIQDAQDDAVEEHLKECVSFCRMAGAEKIYATGSESLAKYPVYTSIYEMRGIPSLKEELVQNIWPVTEENVGRWREIYNHRMKKTDHASTLEKKDENHILATGGAYFIHCAGELLGIGWLDDGCLKAIASVKSGMGEKVAHTLLSVVPGIPVRLEVASTNYPAIRLYEKLGMIKIRECERWYKIF